MTHEDLYRFIAEHHMTVLSTVSPANTPESALVAFAVTPAFEIIFDTVRSSRKYGFLVAKPSIAFVIGWEGEVTVQYEGEAEEPVGERLAFFQTVYFRKFPDAPARLEWPGITYFVVRPKWIRYSDYGKAPAQIVEFTF